MKQDLNLKQACKTCKKELHGREYFLYQLYVDICEVLDERGLLHIEMDKNYLPEFVQKYWDCFSQEIFENEGHYPDNEPQEFDGDERWELYLDAKLDKRTNGFECLKCIISKNPHP